MDPEFVHLRRLALAILCQLKGVSATDFHGPIAEEVRDVHDEYRQKCSPDAEVGPFGRAPILGLDREFDHDESSGCDTDHDPDAGDDEEEEYRVAEVREEGRISVIHFHSRRIRWDRVSEQKEEQQTTVDDSKGDEVDASGGASGSFLLHYSLPCTD